MYNYITRHFLSHIIVTQSRNVMEYKYEYNYYYYYYYYIDV